MKGYKAFNKGLVCRGKQYAENTIFEEDAEIRKCGMYFCKNLLDLLSSYPLVDDKGNVTEFAEVEALDSAETDDGKRFCTKKLKIGTKLSLWQFIKASSDVTYQNIKSQVEALDGETLAGGRYAKLIGNDNAILAGSDCAKLIGGHYAKLIGGNNATLVGDKYVTLVGDNGTTLVGGVCTYAVGGICTTLVGDSHAQLVGDNGATLVGGVCARLVGGNNAQLVGSNCTTLAGGENAIIVGDNGSVAKGKKGSIIVLVERDAKSNIVNFKAVQIDGKKIKEDVLYKLENGKFVEVEE